MFQKTVFVGFLLAGMYALTGYASGTHEHEHEDATSPLHEELGAHGAGDAHVDDGDHEHEVSPLGKPAAAATATKVIRVATLDTMRFEFSSKPELEDGDIVRFVVTNKGKIPHEFSIGDEEEQNAHREMMRDMPNMVHEDGNTITVNPGETKELTWQFAPGGEVIFACNIPGHFEAGMFKKASVGTGHGDNHSH